MRAMITPWIVSGMAIVSIEEATFQRPFSGRTAPLSMRVLMISSRKKGLPSAFWMMTCLMRAGRFSMSRRLFIRSVHSVGERGLRRISV